MPLSAPSRRDSDGRCSRDRAAADSDAAERLRSVRERLEAAVSGLGELEYLRQRQQELVRAALELREAAEEEEQQRSEALSSEEKLLEENILLLRKQLTCLRRRDAGLMSQLQELDRQISDLRLDTEEAHDHLEDSRPSSGFYELSDGASGSLSNSSNSVFSECFCSTVDAEGRLPSTDDSSCLECDGLVGGLCDDPSCGLVRRSFSAPHPPALDPVPSAASMDSQSKYHCDLVARNGSDVYRYPSPLHAVAVQSSAFLQMLSHGGHSRDEGVLKVSAKPDSATLVPQSSSWPVASSSSQTPCHRRLDSYIFSLLQRRVLPIRTSRPRTSINTDPSKSILRQASLCVRQVSGLSSGSGFGTMRGSELKPPRAAGGGSTDGASSLSPQRQWSVESKGEEHEPQNGGHVGGDNTMVNSDLALNQNRSPLGASVQNDKDVSTSSLNKKRLLRSAASTSTLLKDFGELGSPKAHPTPKQCKQPCYPQDQELPLRSQSATPKDRIMPLPWGQIEAGERSVPELVTVRLSSPSQGEGGGDAAGEGGGGHVVTAKSASTQKVKLRKSSNKNIKAVKVKTSQASEHQELMERGEKSHHRSSSKKSRLLEGGASAHIRASKRSPAPVATSSRVNKHLPMSSPEGRVLDKHTTLMLSSKRSGAPKHHHHGNHHHHNNHHHHHHHHFHGRDQVVVIAKPKHKRNDYQRLHRLRAIMEVPHDEAFRRPHQRQRKELPSHSSAGANPPSTEQLISPYCYVRGSDSEYSAECASLFHSTIVDTSEDERSNYTTNCFGDSESSEEEYVEESTTTSDTEESGGGGRTGGRGRSHLGALAARAVGQEMTPAQAKAFVKIKASHNLKKKILRFRSGSLKLMTTV